MCYPLQTYKATSTKCKIDKNYFMAAKLLSNGISQQKIQPSSENMVEGDSLRSPLTQDTNRKAYLSDCRQRPKRCSVQELSQSVNSGCHFSSITFELVLPPCKATSTKCEVHNNLFQAAKLLSNGISQHKLAKLRENHGREFAPLTLAAHKGHRFQKM